MIPATFPRDDPRRERILVLDAGNGSVRTARTDALLEVFRSGDVLVLNDAATLPASLRGTLGGEPLEARLLAAPEDGLAKALLFGAGDWQMPTELRPPPPRARASDRISFSGGLTAILRAIEENGRLVTLAFDLPEVALWPALYAAGRPIQYSYLEKALSLWHVQNRYAGRPWAVEMPSAGHVLDWALLNALRAKGAQVVAVTHAAGLSSTGDASLDARLPLPERYDLPEKTVTAVRSARAEGRRVFAAGTSVVRALEGAAHAHGGSLVAGGGITDLRIDRAFVPRYVTGLLTGMHELGQSHRDLLAAFGPADLLQRGYDRAEEEGFLGHEFGDVCLLLAA